MVSVLISKEIPNTPFVVVCQSIVINQKRSVRLKIPIFSYIPSRDQDGSEGADWDAKGGPVIQNNLSDDDSMSISTKRQSVGSSRLEMKRQQDRTNAASRERLLDHPHLLAAGIQVRNK